MNGTVGRSWRGAWLLAACVGVLLAFPYGRPTAVAAAENQTGGEKGSGVNAAAGGDEAKSAPKSEAGEKDQTVSVPVRKLDFHEEGLSVTERRRKKIPDEKVFQTGYKKGTQVLFNHKGHVENYGLPCIDCHHTEACSDCHKKEETATVVSESKVALHENCTTCHGETGGPTKCDGCHKR